MFVPLKIPEPDNVHDSSGGCAASTPRKTPDAGKIENKTAPHNTRQMEGRMIFFMGFL